MAEIYLKDPERRHSYKRPSKSTIGLPALTSSLGYEIILLPKFGSKERADFSSLALTLTPIVQLRSSIA